MKSILFLAGTFGLIAGWPHADGASTPPFLPTPPLTVSVAGTNGDQNPYGVAFVPADFEPTTGALQPGNILVANFNNSNNFQGTGTTIMQVLASGSVTTFFTVPNAVLGGTGAGLTTGLSILRKGFVIVGSIPSADGTADPSNPGSLLVIDQNGNLVNTLTDSTIDGPWDMTVVDNGAKAIAFVSNVYAGTVVRLDLNVGSTGVTIASKTVIATGYQHRPDPVAFVVGPTGLVYDSSDNTLYVASTEDNAVYAIPGASTTRKAVTKGRTVYSDATHLHGPLGMAEAPNGDLLVANSDVINADPNQPSEIVEFTKKGIFVKELSMDPNEGGSFGLAVVEDPATQSAVLAAVDDNAVTLTIYTLPLIK